MQVRRRDVGSRMKALFQKAQLTEEECAALLSELQTKYDTLKVQVNEKAVALEEDNPASAAHDWIVTESGMFEVQPLLHC